MAEVRRVVGNADPEQFPLPREDWFGGGSTAGAYGLAMEHLAPVKDETVLQIGGLGTHALKLLHAGARDAIVVSPVVSELVQGRQIATRCGLEDRVTFVAGVAEQMPIASGSIGVAYSGSSMHHTDTELSFADLNRVLKPGGRWASVDVWKSRFHSLGTRAFGKCNGNEFCHPLSPERLAPLGDAFPDAQVSFHGGSIRYPLAVAERLGVRPSASLAVRLASVEDSIPLGPLESSLSSLVCLRGTALPESAQAANLEGRS